MKRIRKHIAALLGMVLLVQANVHASVTFNLVAGVLKDAGGNPMPQSGLVILVASTSDSQFNAPTAGAFTSGDDVELARFDCSSLGTPGQLLVQSIASLAGEWGAGDPVAMLWFPGLTTNALAPGSGSDYGFYRDDIGKDHGSPWLTPADGSTINLNFVTTDAGGSNPSSAGLAGNTVPVDCGITTTATAQQVDQTMEMTFANASGLASVQALVMVNCTIMGIAYDNANASLGSVGPLSLTERTMLPANTVKVVLTAAKVAPESSATVNVLALDHCGHGASFDPVITTLKVNAAGLAEQRFDGLPSAEPYLQVSNGKPGLKWLEVNCNGRVFRIDPLADGQNLNADLSRAMLPGENNYVVLTGAGETNAWAWVMISDQRPDSLTELSETMKLSVARSADSLVISWPESASGWQLQSTHEVEAGWSNVTSQPDAVNGRFTIAVPAAGNARFFRLRAPIETTPPASGGASDLGLSGNHAQLQASTEGNRETGILQGIAW